MFESIMPGPELAKPKAAHGGGADPFVPSFKPQIDSKSSKLNEKKKVEGDRANHLFQ